MKLIDIFSQLSSGEFSQLSVGNGGQGIISEKNWSNVINHVNLALSVLYRRFHLKEGKLTVGVQKGMTLYPLNKDYAASNLKSPIALAGRFILDSAGKPFENDIIKIEQVHGDDGFDFTLNERGDPFALYTPSLNSLGIPEDLANDPDSPKLTVTYRASHPLIDQESKGFDPERYEVQLPYSHLDALLFFVASRVHNPVGMTGEFNMGNNYAAKYEKACQDLQLQGLEVDQGQDRNSLRSRGFV